MNKLENYVELLKFKTMIYNDIIDENFGYDECVKYLLSKDFIEKLYLKVKGNEILQSFDEQVKDNIRTIVFFIRQNVKIDRAYVVSLLNQILFSLNVTLDINSLKFYKMEILKRQGDSLYKSRRFLKDKYFLEDDTIQAVRASISSDYNTVASILNDEEEVFVNETVKNELLNDSFLHTLHAVNYDFNQLYKDPMFKKRSIFVLKSIIDVVDNKSKLYKKEDAVEADGITAAHAEKLLKLINKQ